MASVEESATSDRIWFPGNPWPKGHKIKEFEWEAALKEGEAGNPREVWFYITLVTEDYDEEDPEESDDSDSDEGSGAAGGGSDWKSKGVWGNYHACDMSCEDGTGFKLCNEDQYSPDFLDGLEIEVDMQRDLDRMDEDEPAFTIYLLGHDSVGFHRFKFERLPGSDNQFKILWSGKIALSYRGASEFKYDFHAIIGNAEFPEAQEENAEFPEADDEDFPEAEEED